MWSDLEREFPRDEVSSGVGWTTQTHVILGLEGALRAHAICFTEEIQTCAQSYKAS